jgi:asparagine synthase (glutamine-hydrolysing)
MQRHFGTPWLAYRATYSLRLRSGALRRATPPAAWDSLPLAASLANPGLADPQAYLAYRREAAPRFFFDPAERLRYQPYFARWDNGADSAVAWEAEELTAGRLRFFEHTVLDVGYPPQWNRNAQTGQSAPADRHWSQISDFGFGDIKFIWEPSRFGFAFTLVRAYWRSGDERYAQVFWRLVEDWREHNPPNIGPQWKCGQETSFRVLAWCFGLNGFLHSEATTSERAASLAQMLAASGERIAANFDFALSQRNNHGISEALGLWTIGALFPELKQAERWAARGREALEAQGRKLIYDDGAFSQHSANYQRVMLHDYLWALRLGDVLNQPFSAVLRERIARSAEMLYQMQDIESGELPYFGQNDGAVVLPLNSCDYRDFRPVVTALTYLATGKHRYAAGPWDEDLLWLFGPDALRAPRDAAAQSDLSAPDGGYYTLRSTSGCAFIRCASFRHRPSQADLLHVDLWWRGQAIALDAGTYSYNAPTPWDNALAGSAFHNTVTVDGADQMERAGRFLWLPWARGVVRQQARSATGALSYWEGEHDGYHRLKAPVAHRRSVVRLGSDWLVVDALLSASVHGYRLHWLLRDDPYQWDVTGGHLALHTPRGDYHLQTGAVGRAASFSLLRADAQSARGWQAPYYGMRLPALSLDASVQASRAVFWTLFSPQPAEVRAGEQELHVSSEGWQARLAFASDQAAALFCAIRLSGSVRDTLELTPCASS